MRFFFLECWDRRIKEVGEVRCYETGKRISNSFRESSLIYHHILPKEEGQYPQFKYEYWNICFLLPEVHAQVEKDITFNTPRVEKLTKELKQKVNNKEI